MKWYLAVLRNYFGFRGRAGGLEYWIFFLFQAVILGGFYVLGMESGTFIPYLAYALATVVPAVAVIVRRLHDTGRPGWWVLIGLVPLVGTIVILVFMADEGEPSDNRYGPQPDRRHPPRRGVLDAAVGAVDEQVHATGSPG